MASSVDRGAYGACALTVLKTKAHVHGKRDVTQVHARQMHVCGLEYPRICDKLPRKKLRMDFYQFSCELTS
jgi:hypothetical protein